jgi:dUTP diphosphatase
MEHILFKKLSDKAEIPQRAEEDSAGLDLVAAEDMVIEPSSRKLVKTDLAWAAPKGYYGRIAPRSGLAYKKGLDVLAGVIDSSYRGNIGVVLFNTDLYNPIYIKAGDKIAQFIVEKYYDFPIIEVGNLPDSLRNEGGFGSTGS